ncbi:MAG: M48 family metalloprotease, partial [Gammaproteobacteria bacterium]
DLTGALDAARRVADAAKTEPLDEAAEERFLGEQAAREILARAPLAPLPNLQRYVNQLGRYLAARSDRKGVDWRFAVIDDASANAWAAPDGYIFLTTGMLADIDSEAELAGILAHEIQHVVARHHLKAIRSASDRKRFGELAGIARDTAGSYGVEGADVSVPAELQTLRGTISQVYERGLGRGDELDADRGGLLLAAKAGYDPYGLPLVLQKLEARGAEDPSVASFVRTHPSFSERLGKLDKQIGKLDARFFPGRTMESRYRKNAGF